MYSYARSVLSLVANIKEAEEVLKNYRKHEKLFKEADEIKVHGIPGAPNKYITIEFIFERKSNEKIKIILMHPDHIGRAKKLLQEQRNNGCLV